MKRIKRGNVPEKSAAPKPEPNKSIEDFSRCYKPGLCFCPKCMWTGYQPAVNPIVPNAWPFCCAHLYPTHQYVPPGGWISCLKCGYSFQVSGGFTWTAAPNNAAGNYATVQTWTTGGKWIGNNAGCGNSTFDRTVLSSNGTVS